MKIRSLKSHLKGSKAENKYPGAIVIVAEDGKSLFNLTLMADGSLQIDCHELTRIHGKTLTHGIAVEPVAYNQIVIRRKEYEP